MNGWFMYNGYTKKIMKNGYNGYMIFHVTIVPELFSLHIEEGLRPKYQQYM